VFPVPDPVPVAEAELDDPVPDPVEPCVVLWPVLEALVWPVPEAPWLVVLWPCVAVGEVGLWPTKNCMLAPVL
jgi:hypothetical protein